MQRVVAVIQARMTSTRLPGKVLVDIGGSPALEHMLARVRKATSIDHVVVATTANATDDPVVALCERLGVETFRGDEHDVLGRFVGVVDRTGARVVVRLTADCPMIDPALIDQTFALFDTDSYDYTSNANVRSFPDGLDCEVFSADALRRADEEARHPFLREHVTPFIRGSHPQYGAGGFRVGNLLAPADFGFVRWTLDTPADLARIRELIALLPAGYTWMQALSAAMRAPHLLGITQPAPSSAIQARP